MDESSEQHLHLELGEPSAGGWYKDIYLPENSDLVVKIPKSDAISDIQPDRPGTNLDMYANANIPHPTTWADELPKGFEPEESAGSFAIYQKKADRTPADLESTAEVERWLGEIIRMAEQAIENGYFIDIKDINNFAEFNGEIQMIDISDPSSIMETSEFNTNPFRYKELAHSTADTTDMSAKEALYWIQKHSRHQSTAESYW